MIKKIALAADHKGYELKEKIAAFLKKNNYEVTDCGTDSVESTDYPDYMITAAEKLRDGLVDRAIGVCHSGIGSSIIANKVQGVRAALCQSVQEAELSRQHNDANMLILGSAFVKPEIVLPLIETWLKTEFEGGRHERRVNKIKTYENKSCK